MKTQQYITAEIENMFTTTNDRQIMTAFLFGEVLNWTDRKVGKHLRLSEKKVRDLVGTMNYKVGLKDDVNILFAEKKELCCKAVYKHCNDSRVRQFIATTDETRSRLKTYHQSILN